MSSGLSRFNKKPIIVSAGCSFTSPDYISSLDDLPIEKRGGFPIWTDRFWWKLEKFHNKKYRIIHAGNPGGSMDRAHDEIIKNISLFGNKIDFVLWGGTSWDRWNDMYTGFCINPMQYFNPEVRKPINIDEKLGHLALDYQHIFGDLSISLISNFYGTKNGKSRIINDGLRKMWTIIKLCEQYNITFLYYQLLTPIAGAQYIKQRVQNLFNLSDNSLPKFCDIDEDANHEWEMRESMQSPYFRALIERKKHFLGNYYLEPDSPPWQWDNNSNENVIDNTADPDKPGYIRDAHPSLLGHKDIANCLWRHYEANFT